MMNDEFSRVGVILVNYNGYDDTVECVESLSLIDYPNYSIYIVDNGSTDDSIERLRGRFPGITVISSNNNLGFAGGNNLGIERALDDNVDYVLLLNNDTTVRCEFLKKLVQTVELNPNAGIVSGEIRNYDDRSVVWYSGGTFHKLTGFVSHNRSPHSEVRNATFVSGCLMLIDVDTIREIGMLQEDYFMYFEDVEFIYRYLQSGGEILINPNAKIFHKEGSSTGEEDTASSLRAYYDTRNRILFATNEMPFPYNVTSLISIILTRIYVFLYWWWMSNATVAKGGLLGLLHGLQGKTGKHPQYPQ